MARFCPNCGTEVDDTAVFCPTCGQPVDQASETEIPAAPAWPDPAPPAEQDLAQEHHAPTDPGARAEPAAPAPRVEGHTPVETAPPPPPPAATSAARGPAPTPPAGQVNLPITWPVTMSAWLIGIGAAVGALGVFIGFFRGSINPIDLLLLLLLLGIAVTVFFPANIPEIPHLRLATFVVALIAFGIALDRIAIGFGGAGELLLFLGAAAAGMGCILLELGRDQPLGGSA